VLPGVVGQASSASEMPSPSVSVVALPVADEGELIEVQPVGERNTHRV